MTFRMWSVFHFIFILSPFIFAFLVYFFTKKNSYEKNRKLGIILAVICVIILILRNLEIYLATGEINPEIIPFQICHFANFVLLFAFLKDNKVMFATAFCFNFPAAFLSIIFANSLENYQTIFTFRGMAYIFGHLLIVGVTIWALLVGFIKIKPKALKGSVLFVISLFILSIPINNLFNKLMPNHSSNYFYTMLPEEGSPLELMYNLGKEVIFLGLKINFIYVLLTIISGIIVYFSFYFLNKVINRKYKFGY